MLISRSYYEQIQRHANHSRRNVAIARSPNATRRPAAPQNAVLESPPNAGLVPNGQHSIKGCVFANGLSRNRGQSCSLEQEVATVREPRFANLACHSNLTRK